MSQLAFDLDCDPRYSAEADEQTRIRIRVALAALAYEGHNRPIMSDAEFDQLCLKVDVSIATRRPELDAWFKKNFSPETGQWVWKHPERNVLDAILLRYCF